MTVENCNFVVVGVGGGGGGGVKFDATTLLKINTASGL